ncbi:MAG: FAD-dependent oxidoreductase [Clostridiales bacterium]
MSHNVKYINSNDFENEVLISKIPVIVDFFSDDCAPCEILAPILEKMADKYSGHIKFVKILRQDNRELANSLNVSSSPTLMFFKDGNEIGTRLNGFMNKPQVRMAIEEILGDVLPKEEIKNVECDVLILGAGAAGLSAGIYSSRAKMKTVILDESVPGGQTAATYQVENYPGTPGAVKGKEIIENMRDQVISFGGQIDDLKEIYEVNLTEKIKSVQTEDTIYYAKSVIIASGAVPRSLPADGADEFKGKGVHYCATCDGSMYQDRKIVVIGGGISAAEEAIFLTRFASHVTIINKYDKFKENQHNEDILNNPKIDVIWNSIVKKVNGKGYALTSVEVENRDTKEISEIPTEGAFVYIGAEPKSKLYEGQIDINDWGYILTDEYMQTDLEGVFSAGDIREKEIRQVITAASDGAVAGIMAGKYLENNKIEFKMFAEVSRKA